MDILAIIRENLPDGVEVSDKALKAIEKEIKQQQGLEFVPKDQYSKKISIIDDMKKEMEDLLGKSAEGDTYKEKFATLEEEYKNYKQTSKQEFDTFKQTIESEKITDAKKSALHKKLQADGANPNLTALLAKEFDLSKIDIDGDDIKDWDNISKSVKEQYADVFNQNAAQQKDPAPLPILSIGTGKEPLKQPDKNGFNFGFTPIRPIPKKD